MGGVGGSGRGQGRWRQGDERGEYFVHVKGAELKAGRTRGRASGEGGAPKGGRAGEGFDGDETRHNKWMSVSEAAASHLLKFTLI